MERIHPFFVCLMYFCVSLYILLIWSVTKKIDPCLTPNRVISAVALQRPALQDKKNIKPPLEGWDVLILIENTFQIAPEIIWNHLKSTWFKIIFYHIFQASSFPGLHVFTLRWSNYTRTFQASMSMHHVGPCPLHGRKVQQNLKRFGQSTQWAICGVKWFISFYVSFAKLNCLGYLFRGFALLHDAKSPLGVGIYKNFRFLSEVDACAAEISRSGPDFKNMVQATIDAEFEFESWYFHKSWSNLTFKDWQYVWKGRYVFQKKCVLARTPHTPVCWGSIQNLWEPELPKWMSKPAKYKAIQVHKFHAKQLLEC